jgi:hypothetical protein
MAAKEESRIPYQTRSGLASYKTILTWTTDVSWSDALSLHVVDCPTFIRNRAGIDLYRLLDVEVDYLWTGLEIELTLEDACRGNVPGIGVQRTDLDVWGLDISVELHLDTFIRWWLLGSSLLRTFVVPALLLSFLLAILISLLLVVGWSFFLTTQSVSE